MITTPHGNSRGIFFILTNTLSVAAAMEGVIDYTLKQKGDEKVDIPYLWQQLHPATEALPLDKVLQLLKKRGIINVD